MRAVTAVALTLGAALLTTAAAAADTAGPVAFRIDDPRVTESSGLAISRSSPGLAYTVNDSGDGPYVYTVDMDDGAVVGVTTLTGVDVTDVEALAPGPDATLVVADIGDNAEERDSVVVHVIPEPRLGDHSVEPRSVTLTYPDGALDAEGTFVLGDSLVLVSKEMFGGGYYRARVFGAESGDTLRLRRVGDAPPRITDATLLTDGRAVLRNYGQAMVVTPDDWALVKEFRLPRMQQGESIAAAVGDPVVYAGTEGVRSPVHRLDVPKTAGAGGAGDAATAPDEPTGPEPSAEPEATDRPAAQPQERAEQTALQRSDRPGAPVAAGWLVGGGALALAAVATVGVAVRRRRY